MVKFPPLPGLPRFCSLDLGRVDSLFFPYNFLFFGIIYVITEEREAQQWRVASALMFLLIKIPGNFFGDPSVSSPYPRNQPDNLLSCRRVYDPGQDQPGHRDEEGPEDFLHLLVLPERIDLRKVKRP